MSISPVFRTLSGLRVSHLSFSYPGADPLFEDISFSLPRGWTALVGDNGLGKTTLMNLLVGALKPQQGTITPAPEQLVSATCAQNNTVIPDNLEEFGADWSRSALNLRDLLGIGDDWAYRWAELSGGQRKRLQIATTLAKNADLVIIDEPTNHVDEETKAQIITALQQQRDVVGLIISHDRDFVDALADNTLIMTREHVSAGAGSLGRGSQGRAVLGRALPGHNVTVIRHYACNFSEAQAQLHGQQLSNAGKLDQAQAQVKRLENLKRDRQAQVTKIEKVKASGSRIDRHDHDAIRRLQTAKMMGADAWASAGAHQVDAKLQAAQQALSQVSVAAKRYDAQLEALMRSIEPSSRAVVASVERVFLRDVDQGSAATGQTKLTVSAQEHIGIIGRNGAGKTTLLEQMNAAISSGISAYYLPQEISEEESQKSVNTVLDLPTELKSQVLTAVASLNADPDKLLTGKTPSQGEVRKLLLCMALVCDRPQLILLDEPTNHLDISSTEALEQALAAYRGALVIVSHDHRFLRACTTTTWTVSDGQVDVQ